MLTRRQLLRLVPLGAATGLACWGVTAIEPPGTSDVAPSARTGTSPGATPSASGSSVPRPSATVTRPGATAQSTHAVRQAALAKALGEYPRKKEVTFGLALHNARTGQSFSYRGSTSFETASIVKADILSVLLLQAQDEEESLTRSQRSLANVMIRVSDNSAASALWRQAGGARGVRRTNVRLGLQDTTTTTASWGLTRTTAMDQVRLLGAIAGDDGSPLTSRSSDYVLGLMEDVNSAQDWGVPAAARTGERYAVKNGWLPRSTDRGRWIVNSIGRITGTSGQGRSGTDLRIAVLTRGNASMGAGIDLVESLVRLSRRTLVW